MPFGVPVESMPLHAIEGLHTQLGIGGAKAQGIRRNLGGACHGFSSDSKHAG